ncbi:hypothetical protein LCGC14_2442030, partial [marine sediment metagenome]
FHGKPPLKLTTNRFKELIGLGKYHQYLNYFYGITTEEVLGKIVNSTSTLSESVERERKRSWDLAPEFKPQA